MTHVGHAGTSLPAQGDRGPMGRRGERQGCSAHGCSRSALTHWVEGHEPSHSAGLVLLEPREWAEGEFPIWTLGFSTDFQLLQFKPYMPMFFVCATACLPWESL